MTKLKLLLLLFAISTILSHNAFCEDNSQQWNISGGSTALYQHTSANGQGSHTWSLVGSASYFILPQFEAGVAVTYFYNSSQGISGSVLQILAEPTFDFSSDAANSFFIQGGIGVQITTTELSTAVAGSGITTTTGDYTQLAWLVGFGKRFEIVKHLTWTPEVTWSGVKGTTDPFGVYQPTTTNINVIPLQLSAIF